MPLVTGVALSMFVLGLIVSWVLTVVGGAILFVSILWWIVDVKRDYERMAEYKNANDLAFLC